MIKSRKKNQRFEDNKKILTRRSKAFVVIVYMLLIILVIRLGWIQFVKGASLKEAALKQQTTNRIISPKRGTIYDATGIPLAISAEVDTVTINPKKFVVKDNGQKTTEKQQQ